MENQPKLSATESCQDQGVCHDTPIDRFSALPDEIALHILSSLDHEGLTRVGAVSKKLNELYLYTPSFRFDGSTDTVQRKLKRLNCFDQFLRRRGENKMCCCTIDFSLQYSLAYKVPQVMRWINTAARCNVEVLEIYLGIHTNYSYANVLRPSQMVEGIVAEFPSCVFHCRSLKSLSVKMEESFKVPSVPCPNNLQSLSLSLVELNKWFSDWISSSCKGIKELKLDSVWAENLTIESSSLESSTIGSTSQCTSNLRNIKISVSELDWTFVESSKIWGVPYLEKAEIFLDTYQSEGVCDYGNIFEFLCSICKVKKLILNQRTIKTLFSEGSMDAPIFDTSCLCIQTAYLDNSLVPEMDSLMRGMSNLRVLDIKSKLLLSHRKHVDLM